MANGRACPAGIGLALVLAFGLGACGLTTGDAVPVVEVRTSATQYGAQDSISVSVVNRTDQDAWFFHCDHRISFTVQTRRTSTWEDLVGIDGPQCPAIYESGVMRLREGETYRRTFAMDHTGTFRLRTLSSTSELNVGYDILYSNTFTIE